MDIRLTDRGRTYEVELLTHRARAHASTFWALPNKSARPNIVQPHRYTVPTLAICGLVDVAEADGCAVGGDAPRMPEAGEGRAA